MSRIKHSSGECPVSPDAIVRVWVLNDNMKIGNVLHGRADSFVWTTEGRSIESFEVLQDYKPPVNSLNAEPLTAQPVQPGPSPEHPADKLINEQLDSAKESLDKNIYIKPLDMKLTEKLHEYNSDLDYSDFRSVGWTDQQLIDEGYMIKKTPGEIRTALLKRSLERLSEMGILSLKERLSEMGISSLKAAEVLNLSVDHKKPAAPNVRDFNIGDSNYAKHKIQPWDIWLEYDLNPWDADIVKRTLRSKESQSRRMDYEKIIHVAQERIRQIDEESDKHKAADDLVFGESDRAEGGEHF